MGRPLQLAWLGIFQWSIFDHFCPRRAAAGAEQPLLSIADKSQLPEPAGVRGAQPGAPGGEGMLLAEFRLCAVVGSAGKPLTRSGCPSGGLALPKLGCVPSPCHLLARSQ